MLLVERVTEAQRYAKVVSFFSISAIASVFCSTYFFSVYHVVKESSRKADKTFQDESRARDCNLLLRRLECKLLCQPTTHILLETV